MTRLLPALLAALLWAACGHQAVEGLRHIGQRITASVYPAVGK